MRMLAMMLFLAVPGYAMAVPTNGWKKQAKQRVRVTLINISSHQRQVVLLSGEKLALVCGTRTDVEAEVGTTLHIVSDSDRKVDRYLRISAESNRGVIPVE